MKVEDGRCKIEGEGWKVKEMNGRGEGPRRKECEGWKEERKKGWKYHHHHHYPHYHHTTAPVIRRTKNSRSSPGSGACGTSVSSTFPRGRSKSEPTRSACAAPEQRTNERIGWGCTGWWLYKTVTRDGAEFTRLWPAWPLLYCASVHTTLIVL